MKQLGILLLVFSFSAVDCYTFRVFHGAVGYPAFYICLNANNAQSFLNGPLSYLQLSDSMSAPDPLVGQENYVFLAETSNCASANMSSLAYAVVVNVAGLAVDPINTIGIAGSAVPFHTQPLSMGQYTGDFTPQGPDDPNLGVQIQIVNFFPDYPSVEFAQWQNDAWYPFYRNLSYMYSTPSTVSSYMVGPNPTIFNAIYGNQVIATQTAPSQVNTMYVCWGVGIYNDPNPEYQSQLVFTLVATPPNPGHPWWFWLLVIGIPTIIVLAALSALVAAIVLWRRRRRSSYSQLLNNDLYINNEFNQNPSPTLTGYPIQSFAEENNSHL